MHGVPPRRVIVSAFDRPGGRARAAALRPVIVHGLSIAGPAERVSAPHAASREVLRATSSALDERRRARVGRC